MSKKCLKTTKIKTTEFLGKWNTKFQNMQNHLSKILDSHRKSRKVFFKLNLQIFKPKTLILLIIIDLLVFLIKG